MVLATTNVTALPSTFKVSVTTDPAYGGLTDVTNLVDVDVARARVYFPSTMEGMYAQVTYIDQNDSSKTAGTPGGSASDRMAGRALRQRSERRASLASGEHVLPIAAAANESNPSAFLDPTSGLSNRSHYVPHRVWVFWSSTRNAAQQAYSTGGTGSTGSDLYYESMDPNFEPNLP